MQTSIELTPLNCSGSSQEEIGRQMSNLFFSPFRFHGLQFASLEGWYIGLKTLDEQLRLELAQLHGMEAKRRGKKLSRKEKLTHSRFAGVEFALGSPEHHALVKDALREKLLQNRSILIAFLQTAPRPIVHDTGFPESRFTHLPGEAFCRILTELRTELVGMLPAS